MAVAFVDFRVTKFRQNFLQRHLKEKGMLKNLASCRLGAPFNFQAGGPTHVRIPCLMVNPALSGRELRSSVESSGHVH